MDDGMDGCVNRPGAASSIMRPDWRARLTAGLRTPASLRRRALFQELNPEIEGSPLLKGLKNRALREAAVLVPIVARPEPTVVFTLRSSEMPTHAGQIGFPGGRLHSDDPDPVYGALRETHEEIGVAPEAVNVLGAFGVHEGGVGFAVTPVVGVLPADVTFTPCPREVADIFEVPLAHFVNLDNHGLVDKEFGGVAYRMYFSPYKEWEIWGLTAGILHTLAEAMNG